MKRRLPPALGTLLVLLTFVLLVMGCSGAARESTERRTAPQPDAMAPTGTPTGLTEADPVGARGNVTFTTTILATSNRSHLSVCVDGAGGGTATATDVAQVRQALDTGLANLEGVYTTAADYRLGITVSAGCPPPTAALTADELGEQSRTRYGDLLVDPVSVRVPAGGAPSEHRVFVYFVPHDVYGAAFGAKPYAMGSAEFLCGAGYNCAEVTTAQYVTPSVNADVLSDAALDAIGFLPSAGDPPMSPQERNERTRQALEDAGVPQSEIDNFFERACAEVPSAC
ncbi:MAG: hypothetical protein IH959_08365 [Chloroflexi bacterium]|nr:hypothetical protein [Chloroflexota bacterium]